MKTQKSARVSFRELLKHHHALKSEIGEKYYDSREVFRKSLGTFIDTAELSQLTTNEILKLCDLVQTYRPCPLHSFLIRCEKFTTL